MGFDSRKLIDLAFQVSRSVNEVLPPVEVRRAMVDLASRHSSLSHEKLGFSPRGTPIDVYTFGVTGPHVLSYGFPDPGEGLGATGVYHLLRGLVERPSMTDDLPAVIHFIPCMNPDDQPDEGRTIQTVHKRRDIKELDWCVDNPRRETSILLNYAARVQPRFTFALHDEYHCHEVIPVYFGVGTPLQARTVDLIREVCRRVGLEIAKDPTHPTMGDGFFVMADCGPEYVKSTFSRFAEIGGTIVAEMSWHPDIPTRDIVFAQLAAGLIALTEFA
jgi:hypothetical protein